MKFDPETLAGTKLSYSFAKVDPELQIIFFIDNMPFNININIC